MKKILNISVIAALAILPMAANATVADVDKQPTSINMEAEGATTTASNATASGAPKYNLVTPHANDSNVATAGYVKGAYNAAIRAINKVSETAVNAADKNLSNLSDTGKANIAAQGIYDASTNYDANTVGGAIKDLKTNGATQNGVVATIQDATASKTGVNLTVSGTPTGNVESNLSNTSITASVSIPTAATVDTLTVWGDDTVVGTASATLTNTSTAINGTVAGTVTSTFTGTGIDSGTATGDITGIDVTVASYNPGA